MKNKSSRYQNKLNPTEMKVFKKKLFVKYLKKLDFIAGFEAEEDLSVRCKAIIGEQWVKKWIDL